MKSQSIYFSLVKIDDLEYQLEDTQDINVFTKCTECVELDSEFIKNLTSSHRRHVSRRQTPRFHQAEGKRRSLLRVDVSRHVRSFQRSDWFNGRCDLSFFLLAQNFSQPIQFRWKKASIYKVRNSLLKIACNHINESIPKALL